MNPVYALKKNNSWWQTGSCDPSLLHKRIRSEFSKIVESLKNDLITSIEGPTGVGKTSLIFDTINYLLNSGVKKERIVFFSGDDMALFGEHRSVGSLLETYSNDILNENLFEFTSPVYIFIDDIEFIDDWEIYLINYRKKAPNIKFVVSQVPTNSDDFEAENFARISVAPLVLSQFTEFYCANKNSNIDLIRFKSLLPEDSVFGNVESCYNVFSNNIYALEEYKPYKTEVINKFLLVGGYPAYFEAKNIEEWQNYLNKTSDMSLYRDVASLAGLKAPQKLKRLLYIIAEHGESEQSYGNIGRSLYVDTSTIIGYINAMSKGGYSGVAENYSLLSSVEGRVVRKNKKFYVYDIGLRNAVLGITDITPDYENAVKFACVGTAKKYADEHGGSIYFWKDGNRSCDFVVSCDSKAVPVSVCYKRENITKAEKNLRAFMRTYSVRKSVIITRDVLKSDGKIFCIPYWMI